MVKKYKTRDGFNVEILKTDLNLEDGRSVVALIERIDGLVLCREYFSNGDRYIDEEFKFDLVEVPPYDDFKIDDKVLVWGNESIGVVKRYFAGITRDGKPMTFPAGATSFSHNKNENFVVWGFCKKWEEK